ncbi:MAG: GNAT family N-acetyltransferase [Candidatus Cybelea sp.]
MTEAIITSRLLLRRWTPQDVGEMSEIYADPKTMRWFGFGTVFSQAQVADSLVSVIAEYADSGFGNYAIIERQTTKIIGHCGLHRKYEPDIEVEIDCLVARGQWGFGYGTEASDAVIRQAFLADDVSVISGVAHRENKPAIALMERLGMSYVSKRKRFGIISVLYQIGAASFQGAH